MNGIKDPATHLHVYAEIDPNTGIWTIDVPQWFIHGEKASGPLEEAAQSILKVDPSDRVVLHYHDLGGRDLDYSG